MKPRLTLLDTLRPHDPADHSNTVSGSLTRLKRSLPSKRLAIGLRSPSEVLHLRRPLQTPSPTIKPLYNNKLPSLGYPFFEEQRPKPKELIQRILVHARRKQRESTSSLELKLVAKGSISPRSTRKLPKQKPNLHRKSKSTVRVEYRRKAPQQSKDLTGSEFLRPKGTAMPSIHSVRSYLG